MIFFSLASLIVSFSYRFNVLTIMCLKCFFSGPIYLVFFASCICMGVFLLKLRRLSSMKFLII